MLNRKPRIGEILIYEDPPHGPVEIEVMEFCGCEPQTILVQFAKPWFCGQPVLITWKHVTGELNPCLRHTEEF